MRELQYPKVSPGLNQVIALDSEDTIAMPDECSLNWQARMAMANGITKAIHQEFVDLRHFWSLGTPGGEHRTEEVVAKSLKRLAACAEEACIVQALRPSAAVDLTWSTTLDGNEQMEDLEKRYKKLEDELAVVDKQLVSMKEMETEFSQARGVTDLHDNFDNLVARLSIDGCNTASPYTSMATPLMQEVAGQLDQCLERLALIDLAFSHASAGLNEEEKQLVEREHAALAGAWAHFPRKVLDPQGTLAGLP